MARMPFAPDPQAASRFRKLRIAWSVAWVIACGMVLMLLARSYWRWDWVSIPVRSDVFLSVNSGSGRIYASTPFLGVLQNRPTKSTTVVASEWRWWSREPSQAYFQRVTVFGGGWDNNSVRVRFPHWFLALLFATVAASPWFRWRFSLRTLLIATTLVAVLLGIAMYFAPRPATAPRIDHVDLPVL